MIDQRRQPLDIQLIALAAFALLGTSGRRGERRSTGRRPFDIDVRPLIPLAIVLWPEQQVRKAGDGTGPIGPQKSRPVPPERTALSVAPERTTCGEEVTIMGLGNHAESAGFHWETADGAPLAVKRSGDGTATVIVPEDARPGKHWICVVDTSRDRVRIEPGEGRVEVVVETEPKTRH